MKTLRDEERTLSILSILFPGVPITDVKEISIGWTSEVLIMNREYIVKIPRNQDNGFELEKEMEITNTIRDLVSVRIPDFFAVSRNNKVSAAAYKKIGGILLTSQDSGEMEKLDPASLNTDAIESLSRQIGRILCDIHDIDKSVVGKILSPHTRTTWKEKIIARITESEKTSNGYFEGSEGDRVNDALNGIRKEVDAMEYTETFIHGDFGGWNILCDPLTIKITGLLDWADCRIGDPAIDFTELIYDYGEEFAQKILNSYNCRNDTTIIDRARIYLKLAGFQDLKYGLEAGKEFFVERGKRDILKLINKKNYVDNQAFFT